MCCFYFLIQSILFSLRAICIKESLSPRSIEMKWIKRHPNTLFLKLLYYCLSASSQTFLTCTSSISSASSLQSIWSFSHLHQLPERSLVDCPWSKQYKVYANEVYGNENHTKETYAMRSRRSLQWDLCIEIWDICSAKNSQTNNIHYLSDTEWPVTCTRSGSRRFQTCSEERFMHPWAWSRLLSTQRRSYLLLPSAVVWLQGYTPLYPEFIVKWNESGSFSTFLSCTIQASDMIWHFHLQR